ncbi:hypothetical protein [Streptomyces sp. H27-C3]|uniref:hypothetical protein n=1 Tax=Streptomyces sp. H27-C3 TaxID=3046305 RepID=UPI0024B936B7|nr:hypothetical protein [Streptomyces sp. H27-C3]MDJ0461499.1 hypothetical protein [Streptomyces sp. H27-C3]
MKIAIGDVVRDRSTMAIGTVAGHAAQDDGEILVALRLSGGAVHLAEPEFLDVVARCSRLMATDRLLATRCVLALAVLAAICGFRAAQELGGGWLLMFLAGLGSYSAVMTAYQWCLRLTGPRAFHV